MSAVRQQQDADPVAPAAELHYTGFAAFRAVGTPVSLRRTHRAALAKQALRTLCVEPGLSLRGSYDTSGYRADVSLLLWLAAPSADLIQDALAGFGRTSLATALEPVWTAVGVHRRGQFTRLDVPAYFRGENARRYVCVSAMAHTPEWYRLESELQRRLLLDYARITRDHGEVLANTVSSFALSNHEWLHAYESDQLTRIVDLIRALRGSEARRYILPEERFITGVLKPLAEIVTALP